MSRYYPQVAVQLEVLWENYQKADPLLEKRTNIVTLAKKVTVGINDYRQADTFRVELDYKCFPFDPRLIRAAGVSIYIEDMRKLLDQGQTEVRIDPSSENIVFMGFADEDGISMSDSDRTVTLEGRDFTSLFIDRPYPYGTLDLGKSVDQVVKGIVAQLNGAEKIEVDNRTGGDLITLGKYYADRANGKATGKKNVRRGETFWDVIQDIVGRAGLICYIELDRLVITKPQNLYAGVKTYQFIYGRNLKSFKLNRKLSKQKGFNVIVRSLSMESKRVIEAKIPEEASLSWCSQYGLSQKRVTIKKPVPLGTGKEGSNFTEEEAPFIAFNLPNVQDKLALVERGQAIFEELARQQIEGSLETKEMRVLQKDDPTSPDFVEYDILKIRTATPVAIGLVEDELEQVRSISGDTPEAIGKRETYLLSRGYPGDFAHALAVSLGRFQTTFYTKAVEFSMDQKNGFSMKLDFLNFIDLKSRGL